jgi:ADP-ribose pyrophosphatase YjhB (NUDIX family)
VVYVTPADAAALRLPSAGVILVRRGHQPLAGEWSLPGGTLEVGETLEAAIAREVAEETGLDVEVGPVIEVFDRIMLDDQQRVQYHFVLVDYLCRPAGGELRAGSDAADIAMADPAALERFRLTDKANSVIARGVRMALEERES